MKWDKNNDVRTKKNSSNMFIYGIHIVTLIQSTQGWAELLTTPHFWKQAIKAFKPPNFSMVHKGGAPPRFDTL